MSKTNTAIKKKYFSSGCNMCQADISEIELVGEIDIYGRIYTTKFKKYWRCKKCGSYVGCHNNGRQPFGILSNKENRLLKKKVHSLFDPIWWFYHLRKDMPKLKARGKAYRWLSRELDINAKDCHIGMFDNEACLAAIEVLKKAYSKSISLRRFKKEFLK